MNSTQVEFSAPPPPTPQTIKLKLKNARNDDETGQWQCPLCLQNTFPDLTKVGTPPWWNVVHPQAVRNKGQWQCPFWSKRGKNSTCGGSAKHPQPTPHPPEKKAHFWLPLYGAFFAWRHIRHVGVPNQSCGSGTFFLSKHFLLFQWFCKAAGQVSDFLWVSCWRRKGLPFYSVIRATRWPSRLQGKGSTFISLLL